MNEQKPFDFESVQYPMFKVTEEEKQDLIRARAMPVESSPEFLCIRVQNPYLESKIQKSLEGAFILEQYLFPNIETKSKAYEVLGLYGDRHDFRKLRDVWVDKLLAFNS